MPALEVDPEEPGQGMAPSRSILAGTYNQTYLIRTLSSICCEYLLPLGGR